MSQQDERRKYRRFSTDEVGGIFSYSVNAGIDNLSLGGFAVRTNSQLQVGRIYSFRLGDDRDSVQLEGKVKWCRLAGTVKLESGDVAPVYSAGVAFEGILTTAAEKLQLFMERNVIIDVERRIFGRLKVEREADIDLATESRFLIKQLSASGMLIVTELSPKPESLVDVELQLGAHVLRWKGRVVHAAEVGLVEEDLRYRVGIEFVEPPKSQQQVLMDFIRNELEPRE
jgi:hypothetical protein